jgi:hypothetical protein
MDTLEKLLRLHDATPLVAYVLSEYPKPHYASHALSADRMTELVEWAAQQMAAAIAEGDWATVEAFAGALDKLVRKHRRALEVDE